MDSFKALLPAAFLIFVLAAAAGVCAEPLPEDAVLILDPGHGGKNEASFIFNGRRYPENSYAYDVAKRAERIAKRKGLKTFFTVVDPKNDGISDFDESGIIPPRRTLVYNSREGGIVFGERGGLLKRLEAAREFAGASGAKTKIFVSLHFDHAHFMISGVKIFTAKGMKKHPFVEILAEEFRNSGRGLKFGGVSFTRFMVEDGNEFVVLKENEIAPRVLIELANFNNANDRLVMLRSAEREKCARIIVAAVEKYLEKYLRKT